MRALNVVLVVTVLGTIGFAFTRRDPIAAESAAAAAAPAPARPAPSDEAEPSAALEGEVLEVIDVPSYTYVRIGESGSEGTWAAVPSTPIAKGTRTRVISATKMVDFRSEKLNKTFDVIYFGTLDGAQPGGADPSMNTALGSNPHAQTQPKADVPVGKVEKAKGSDAYRISELYAQKSKLGGKTVRVRGVVVKSTAGVLGKTFLHLRDGSGDAKSANNDLAVTTVATTNVGDTITIEGAVSLAKDIGAGYRYDVIVEEARLITE